MAAPTDEDDLYGLPLEEFTAARNALAKELARTGEADASRRVKALPKPTRTAWALNQLARRRPDDVERLLEAGARVRDAQERALAGDASELRPANRLEQERLDILLDAAEELLGTGTSAQAASRERLRKTLRAAATDPEVGTLLRRGRLVGDVEMAGFGLEDLDPAVIAEAAQASPAADRKLQERRRQAQAEADRLQHDAERAGERARRLAEQAERAERRAREAREEADRAHDEALAAQRAADEARSHLDGRGSSR